MPKDKQKELLQELSASILNEMLTAISAGRVPEEWNGFELRQWFADKAAASLHHAFKDDRRRWRAYQNHVLVNRLT